MPRGSGNSAEVFAVGGLFLRLGFTAFGGPAAHVALMEHEVVTRRMWLTRAEFLDTAAAARSGRYGGPGSAVGISGWVRRLITRSRFARAGLDGIVVSGVALLGRAVVQMLRPMQPHQWLMCIAAVAMLFVTRLSATVLLLAAMLGGLAAALRNSSLP